MCMSTNISKCPHYEVFVKIDYVHQNDWLKSTTTGDCQNSPLSSLTPYHICILCIYVIK